jgi:dihydroneopterin aldolase
MKHTISLDGLRFFAFHGFYPEERKMGNTFIVHLSVDFSFQKASVDDNLSSTLDYQSLYSICKHEMAIPSDLIEHVSGRIKAKVKTSFPEITEIRLEIRKIGPQLGGIVGYTSVFCLE